MTPPPHFHLDDVTLGYEGHPAVHHLTGRFEAGSMTAIYGPNGSGKSTLLKGLIGRLKPLSGAIGRPRLDVRDIAYLPQAQEIDRSFPASVHDLVSLGLLRKTGLFSALAAAEREAVAAALAAVGLGGFHSRQIGSLSGGQLQRALFARVLLQDAKVILLDEPFSAIDSKTVNDLLSLIHRWHGERRTIIAVLHDHELIRAHFPEALVLAREPVAWGSAETALAPANLLKARRMNEGWEENAPWCGERAA
ncbi:MAG: metal ABC transporter ATP-binding protein [Aestuariivirga sp.]|uniref:metal ABC transporter ATP-binding protein n=1 Tax=Aestuariivirga sp. TaxID=2650926 RepID=UPI0038D1CB7D